MFFFKIDICKKGEGVERKEDKGKGKKKVRKEMRLNFDILTDIGNQMTFSHQI